MTLFSFFFFFIRVHALSFAHTTFSFSLQFPFRLLNFSLHTYFGFVFEAASGWKQENLPWKHPTVKKKEAFLTRRCIAFVHDANPYVCCERSRTRSGASSWLHGRIPVPGVYPVTLWAWHFTNEKTLEERSYVTLYLQSNASFLSSVTAVRTRHHLVPEFLLHFRHF